MLWATEPNARRLNTGIVGRRQPSQLSSKVATAACAQREVGAFVRELCSSSLRAPIEMTNLPVLRPQTTRLAQDARQTRWSRPSNAQDARPPGRRLGRGQGAAARLRPRRRTRTSGARVLTGLARLRVCGVVREAAHAEAVSRKSSPWRRITGGASASACRRTRRFLRLHWAHGRYGVHGDALRLARGARGRRRETPQFVGDAAEARAAATARAVSHGEKIAGCPR